MAATVMEEIAARCVAECVRQEVGIDAVGRLLVAYSFALERASTLPTEDAVREIARIIEPATEGTYRQVPVTFRDGGSATDWREVPGAMQRLFGALEASTEPADTVKAFLRIHPFKDGNGRAAFLLFNWLGETLQSPAPLPEFDW